MDGNGRWAKQRGLPRVAGHRAGAEAVRRALQAAADTGVEVLTIYAFSSENWRRTAEEISDLTALMRFYLERELKTLQKEGVRLKLIGDHSAFGGELSERLEKAVERTASNTRLTLVVALSYGSRAEIAAAARELAAKAAAGDIDPAAIDEVVTLSPFTEPSGLRPLLAAFAPFATVPASVPPTFVPVGAPMDDTVAQAAPLQRLNMFVLALNHRSPKAGPPGAASPT